MPALAQVDVVHGALFTLTDTPTAPNGAWSWYEDERAIVDFSDPANPLLLASSISSGPNGDPESGDVDLLWRNLITGAQGEFELNNRFERDDHDTAALYIRPDGRYLAMYAKHISDPLTRWRISTNPGDPTAWGPEQTLNNGAGTTYNNTYYLPDDNGGAGRTYNFTRAVNFDPMVQVSDDDGTTWNNVGKLLTQGGGGDRPYVRYASDGKKIHFIATEEHPRDFLNSIYHGYVQDGVLYNTDGDVIDGNLFDASGVSPTALPQVFANGSEWDGTTMNRAWTINMEIDNTGNPVGIFTARANDDDDDHRFFYARHNGAEWRVHEMAEAGGFLYNGENDYTGLASIDPQNPNVVYMSSEVDPRDGSSTTKYELYKGVTADFGESWAWTPITENSTVDNLRPVVPSWDGQNTAVTWMRGNYNTYTNWDTEIVGLNFTATDPKSQLWQGQPGASADWDQSTANWNSGGGTSDTFSNGDEVAFDDTAETFNVHLGIGVAPNGVAFNNTSNAYTLTGEGIGGAGGLRVIGGGVVTLNNGDNTYTGPTLVHRGTLGLSGSGAISGSSEITIAEAGTLDVSGRDDGTLFLDGQTLTLDGDVVGNVMVANGAVVGGGTIGGDLFAASGGTVQVGDAGIDLSGDGSGSGPLTYLDAATGAGGNTTLSNGAAFSPPVNGSNGSDNQWELRTNLASHGTVLESGGETGEDAPGLKTTLTGLAPNSLYDLTVLFWDASGGVEDWNIRAGLSPTELTLFANGDTSDAAELGAVGAVSAASLSFESAPTLTSEANRTMYAGLLGEAATDANGQIEVFVNDLPSTIGANNRTWYDGLGYRLVEAPAGLVVSMAVTGDYTQDAAATLSLDVVNATTHDRFDVVGQADLDGTLVLTVDDPSALAVGEVFTLLTAGAGVVNTFKTVLGGALGDIDGQPAALAVVYGSNEVTAQVALLGDANLSGQIEQGDLDAVLQNWGRQDGTWVTGDYDGDGFVAQGDLDAVLQNWGAAAAPDLRGFSLPEPVTAVQLTALMMCCRWRIVPSNV